MNLLTQDFYFHFRRLCKECSPRDPVTLLGASLLLMLVSAAACIIPALRAISVDPMVALRYE